VDMGPYPWLVNPQLRIEEFALIVLVNICLFPLPLYRLFPRHGVHIHCNASDGHGPTGTHLFGSIHIFPHLSLGIVGRQKEWHIWPNVERRNSHLKSTTRNATHLHFAFGCSLFTIISFVHFCFGIFLL
jgi:nitrate reductase NapE component